MTPDDDTFGNERGSPPRQAGSDGRYVSYETDDGALVIRDESDADAWIRSDTAVSLATDEE